MSTKAMSSAEKDEQEEALCLHISVFLLGLFHRAKARELEAAKRIRACTADQNMRARRSVVLAHKRLPVRPFP